MPHVRQEKTKYLRLPGAPKPLFGVASIRGIAEVFVCEGAFDYLTLVEWGYPTVALFGSHLKHDQISEIADAARIFIATDSDKPGRKSARQLPLTNPQKGKTTLAKNTRVIRSSVL